jgi:sugar phosphate isomerase/epimerase
MTRLEVSPIEVPPEQALSVCQITTKYLGVEDEVRAYKAAGMNGISLWLDKIRAYGVIRGAKLLRESGLPVISMVGAPCILPTGVDGEGEAFDDLCDVLDDCEILGVPVLGVVPGNRYGRSLDAMESMTVETLSRLGEEARQRGVILAVEAVHEPYVDFLNSLADADRVVRAVGLPSVGLLFDAWHLCHEPDLDTRVEETASRIALVHFSDWRDPTRYHDDRLLPGEGVLPLKSILQKLNSSGYAGFYDVEIFSEDIWRGDQAENLRICRAFFDSVWGL